MRILCIPDFITKEMPEVNDLEDAKMRKRFFFSNQYVLFIILRGDERPLKENNNTSGEGNSTLGIYRVKAKPNQLIIDLGH